MKKLFCTFCLIGLMASWAFAQLPFEPFVAYPGNPVIPRGPAGSWDAGVVIHPAMVFVNDTFNVWYEGVYRDFRYYPNEPMSLGLATSIDGYTFTKDPNPILWGDSSGFDAFSVLAGALYYDNVHWYLYYGGIASPPLIPGRIVSRAIATSPHGPWVRTHDTLLVGGSFGEWDDKVLAPLQILPTDSGLVMYYAGSDDWNPNAFTMQLGMATSTNGGTTWQKYNDPTTTTPPYAESDPVLKPGPGSYDIQSIWGAGVIQHNNLWEMFYAGQTNPYSGPICYATSTDGGIHWTKYWGNPIFTYLNDPVSVGVLLLPFVAFVDSMYFLLYDYGVGQAGIGLATANIVSGLDEETIPTTFSLEQNYPNPFNPITTISWQSPVGSHQTIKIFDVLGNEIATLIDEYKPSGKYEVEFNAEKLSSGVYFYMLQAGSFIETKKMILLR